MSKNIVAYNCDYLEIKNSVPFCTHPNKPRMLCEPFDLACDSATFDKIYYEHATDRETSSDRCIVCRHNCQARVYDRHNSGTRCGDHPMSDGCIYKDRCKARVASPGRTVHYCLAKNKDVDWFDTCELFEKRGDRSE